MVDRITMPSRRNDGTINETDPVFIGPKDDAVDGVEHQLACQAVADALVKGEPLPDADFRSEAEAEVDKLHISAREDLANSGDPGATGTTPAEPLVSPTDAAPLEGKVAQPAGDTAGVGPDTSMGAGV